MFDILATMGVAAVSEIIKQTVSKAIEWAKGRKKPPAAVVAQKVEQLEHENKPVEVDDKHKLRDLHDTLVANDLFKRFTAAQVEYVDLMRQVNQTLRKQLAEVEK